MDTAKKFELPERNPKTHAEHRREVFWQITLPLIIGFLLLLAALGAIIFSITQPATQVERWADVSLMWLIAPSLIFALIILVILVAFIYVITLLLRVTPRYARLVQYYLEVGEAKVRQVADWLAEPILRLHGILAVLRRVGRRARQPSGEQ
ncbi:MAG: hypothetical protein ACM3H7_02900 [Acidobacteriaceae bacterium]